MTAEDMFHQLGYGKVVEHNMIKYIKPLGNGEYNHIYFDLFHKTVISKYEYDEDLFEDESIINIGELTAINKQVKELKWLEI